MTHRFLFPSVSIIRCISSGQYCSIFLPQRGRPQRPATEQPSGAGRCPEHGSPAPLCALILTLFYLFANFEGPVLGSIDADSNNWALRAEAEKQIAARHASNWLCKEILKSFSPAHAFASSAQMKSVWPKEEEPKTRKELKTFKIKMETAKFSAILRDLQYLHPSYFSHRSSLKLWDSEEYRQYVRLFSKMKVEVLVINWFQLNVVELCLFSHRLEWKFAITLLNFKENISVCLKLKKLYSFRRKYLKGGKLDSRK